MGENGMERRMFVQGRIPSQWLVDQMPEAIWATDGALRFVAVGGAAAGSLGLEPDRVLGTSVYDYFQTTDPAYPALAAHLHALQGNVESYRFERGGRVFTVTVGPVRHAIGRVVGVVACAVDVTELVAAAEQAASRYTLEAIPACVLRLDDQLRVTFANASARRLLDLEEREPKVLGELPAVAPLEELARRAWHLGEAAALEVPLREEGQAVYRWQAAPEVDAHGGRRGVVLVGWEVTDTVRRLQAAQREGARWEAWAQAAAEVVNAADVTSLGERLLHQSQKLSGARHGGVALWESETGHILVRRVEGAVSEPAWERVLEQASVGEAVWLDTATDEARLLGITATRFRKALVVPVHVTGVNGVLFLAWEWEDPEPAEDACPVVRLSRLAGAVGSVRVRLQRTEEAAEALGRERQVAAGVAEAPDLPEAADRWLRGLVEVLGASGAAVYVAEGDLWARVAQAGERHPAATFGLHEGAAAEAVRTGQTQRVSATRGDPAFVGYGAEGVVVPLPTPKPCVLAVESAADHGFAPADVELLDRVSGQLAAVVRWHEQAAAWSAQAERYRKVLDSTPAGTVLVDGSRVVRYANAAAAALLGRVPDDVVGRPVLELVHPEDRGEAAAVLSRVYAEAGAVVPFTVRLLRRDASAFWAEAVASNRLDEPGVAGLLLSLRDVSAQREAEQALARRAADLEVLSQFGAALQGVQTAGEAATRAAEHGIRLLGADHASVAVLDPDGDSYTVTAARGVLAELEGMSFPLVGVHGHVIGTGEVFRSDQLPEDPFFSQAADLGPVLVVPLRTSGRVLGSLAVARRAGSPSGGFDEHDTDRLAGLAQLASDVLDRVKVVDALERAYTEVVLSLARAMDAHDGVGPGHGTVVAHWAEALARRMGCSPAEAREVRWAALLHNVGKVAIPEEILRKAGPLSSDELALLQRYPVIGEQILEAVPRFRGVAKLVRHHRERWDGTGYPDGLKGEEIPLGARILAVVDAYNAMTDHRRYKVARSHADAVAELQRNTGTQFDPAVVRAFLELLEESRSI
ncbi:MAG: PAS domain-containing protein [Armatimonadota bacterium]|nr:PAS domain-containing protein [Armatimonadota bacterium]MDR7388120.1 PAS domain-containing protein [Armatimonadota bacterium]MDR7395309.1 PAS domain-containing protein [Armatimonadota bacterium]MDR7398048.1 PAS domain-containing protein [Armatimonadota bacterium]MDR7406373.1 PAS domain-containing protein [Armatimonadota bacterium]